LDKYYKSRVHASSVIAIRPTTEEEQRHEKYGFNYKILIMKRAPGIVFGGFYAFSGGKVEL
jgi:8-oxo-dGTP pyrophosphatase MutT (NUDIX family)